MDIKSKFIVHLTDNFHNGGQQTVEEVRAYFESVKNEVADGVRSRMREFSGEEKLSVQAEVTGTDEISLHVWSEPGEPGSAQAYVDEFGQEPGSPGGAKQHFPPFGPESTLFKWVVQIINPQPKAKAGSKKKSLASLSTAARLKLANQPQKFAFGHSLLNLQKSVTFMVARAINERGLPRPGDPLRAPFATTREAMLPQIQEGLAGVGASVAQQVNG